MYYLADFAFKELESRYWEKLQNTPELRKRIENKHLFNVIDYPSKGRRNLYKRNKTAWGNKMENSKIKPNKKSVENTQIKIEKIIKDNNPDRMPDIRTKLPYKETSIPKSSSTNTPKNIKPHNLKINKKLVYGLGGTALVSAGLYGLNKLKNKNN